MEKTMISEICNIVEAEVKNMFADDYDTKESHNNEIEVEYNGVTYNALFSYFFDYASREQEVIVEGIVSLDAEGWENEVIYDKVA